MWEELRVAATVMRMRMYICWDLVTIPQCMFVSHEFHAHVGTCNDAEIQTAAGIVIMKLIKICDRKSFESASSDSEVRSDQSHNILSLVLQ
mmetsp:Transcript_77326/g.170806  ORF Transcript_77326/g.170806 Transcript_77326/m.170806 type:complete len:91 (-) Transcript_77326:115-387(-)